MPVNVKKVMELLSFTGSKIQRNFFHRRLYCVVALICETLSALTSKKTQHLAIATITSFVFKEMITVSSENHMKPISTLCGGGNA